MFLASTFTVHYLWYNIVNRKNKISKKNRFSSNKLKNANYFKVQTRSQIIAAEFIQKEPIILSFLQVLCKI